MCCGPERSILQLLQNSSMLPRQNPLVWRWTVSMVSTWVAVEAARTMKSSIPVNCPWGSTCSCPVAPIHFWSPIGGAVSSLHVRVPPTGPCGPPAEDPACSAVEAALPVDRRGARTLQSCGPPSTFGRYLQPGFKPLHVHVLGPILLL
jgi:hypothetical protein